MLGAYLGEAIIQNCNGAWEHDAQGWHVCFDGENRVYPFGKVSRQLLDGPDEFIFAFYFSIPALFRKPACSYLHVDTVLATLIDQDEGAAEQLVSADESGTEQFLIPELALYDALCCVHAGDRPNFHRLSRLLRCAQIVPGQHPFEPPGNDEITQWRTAALNFSSQRA